MSEPRWISGPFGRVALWDTAGRGPTLVLLHGNSASSRAFGRQLDGELGRTHRLIAFDLLGHGRSDNATDPSAYLLSGHAKTLTSLVADLGLDEAVFAGWSLGGHILLEAAPDLPKAKGFAIFGTPPIGFPPAMDRAFLPNPAFGLGLSPDLTREQAEAYASAGFAPGFADAPAFFADDILRTDGRARAQVGASIDPTRTRDELEVVAALSQPLAILHGQRDQLVNGDYLKTLTAPTLWRGAIHTFAGAGHTPQWETSSEFDATLAEFVRDCA